MGEKISSKSGYPQMLLTPQNWGDNPPPPLHPSLQILAPALQSSVFEKKFEKKFRKTGKINPAAARSEASQTALGRLSKNNSGC